MKSYCILIIVLVNSCISWGQDTFTTIGNAFGIGDITSPVCPDVDTCFTLTPDLTGQVGAVWDDTPIDLTLSFDALFCLTLGSNDGNGADGFAFVMRGLGSPTIGNVGGGIGYEGITPSIAIEYDTWDNGVVNNDLPQDHTGMYRDANWAVPVFGAVPLDPSGVNVEDGNYHNTRIIWDATAQQLDMYFDGNLRISQSIDLINTVFGGASVVYWGFTSSTGGATNLQQICFPYTDIQVNDVIACYPDSAALSFYTENITSYTWYNESGDTLVDWNTIDYTTPFDLNDTLIYVYESGNYTLEISFNNNSYSDVATVTIVPLPIPPFEEASTIYCPDQENLILDALNPGMSYDWSPPFPNTQVISDNGYVGWYSVTITEPVNNCVNSDSIYVDTYCEPVVSFANVFTPNEDGINDLYTPIYAVDPKWVKVSEFEIQNRWGNIVYTYDPEDIVPVGWDGMVDDEPASVGVYFYRVTYTDINGELEQSEHGFLHLMRDE